MRSPANKSNKSQVEAFIDTSYDKVATVADNLDAVLAVEGNIENSLRYLGVHPSIPDTRLDGSPIQDSDYYLDSTTNSFFYYVELSNEWIESDTEGVDISAEEARLSAEAALLSETNAAASESLVESHKNAAALSETNAALSEGLAQDWAEKADDTDVTDEGTRSAKHYANTARDSEYTSTTNAANTSLDALSTASDVLITNADVVKTNADVVTTGSHVNTTNINVQTTVDNVAITNADAVKTGVDASTTTSDRVISMNARDDAVVAKDFAETAESNAKVSEVNAKASEVASSTSESNALSYSNAASISETNSANSESVSAANANFFGNWVDLTGAANVPYSVHHDSAIWMLVNSVPNIVLTEPSAVNNDWIQIGSTGGTATDASRLGGNLPSFYLNPDNHDDSSSVNKWITQGEKSKLSGIEAGATADQTATEIEALYEGISNTNKFTTAEKNSVASALQPSDNITQLTNNAGFITSADLPNVPVASVNGETGAVVLDASDVGALADSGNISLSTGSLTLDSDRFFALENMKYKSRALTYTNNWSTNSEEHWLAKWGFVNGFGDWVGLSCSGNSANLFSMVLGDTGGFALGNLPANNSPNESATNPVDNMAFRVSVSGQVYASDNIYEKGTRVYSPNNKPTASDVGASPLETPIVADFNDVITNTCFMGLAAANSPVAGWAIGTCVRHNHEWVTQTVWAFDINSNTDTKTYRREMNGTVWGPWAKCAVTTEEQGIAASSFYYNNGGGSPAISAVKGGRLTRHLYWNTTPTITLDYSSFQEGDEIELRFNAVTGTSTIITDTGLIYLPDGSSGASHTITGVATVKLVTSDGWFMITSVTT